MTRTVRVLAAAALTLLASSGCANTSPATVPNSASQVLAAKVAARSAKADPRETIFVSIADAGTVEEFDASGPLIGTISGLSSPTSLATDARGRLFVATGSGVVVFAKPYERPAYVIGSGMVTTVAVSFADGLLALGSPSSIALYRKDATEPCAAFAAPSGRLDFAGFDASGTLMLDGVDARGKTVVAEIAGGCSARGVTMLLAANGIGFPGGIGVDANNRPAVLDQRTATIDTYARTTAGALGAVVARTKLTEASDPVTFAFAPNGAALFAVDAGLGTVSEVAYPGGALVRRFAVAGLPLGVAVTPQLRP